MKTIITSDVAPYIKFPYAPDSSKVEDKGEPRRFRTVDSLALEYVDLIKSEFDPMFGQNATRRRNAIGGILIAGGFSRIKTLSNFMFGGEYEIKSRNSTVNNARRFTSSNL